MKIVRRVININSVCLVGNLTKDVELRQVNEQTTCAMFTLAVQRDFKNPDGTTTTDFISCVAWNGQANFLSRYCKKGDKIGIVGRIQARNYQDQQGQTHFITEVICNSVESYTKREQPQQQPTATPTNKNTGVKVNGNNVELHFEDDEDVAF